MDPAMIGLVLVLLLVLAAEFVNGWTDAANAIATVVSTRVLSPKIAVIMAAVLNTIGTLMGTAVAKTIAGGYLNLNVANDLTIIAAGMLAIVIWSTFAWRFGLPTSETHALAAGLTGAGLAAAGWGGLEASGWIKIGKGLLFSSFLGFFAGMFFLTISLWLFRKASRATSRAFFSRAQVFSAAFMALSHGTNDGQKFIGAFSLALVLGNVASPNPDGSAPIFTWVILLCSIVMGLGTYAGGWRIIKTMGMRMARLEPYQGFAAETGAAATIQVASYLGIPLSTTHTISTSIMGVGAARRVNAVRWRVVGELVLAWVVTFPICFGIGFGVSYVLKQVF